MHLATIWVVSKFSNLTRISVKNYFKYGVIYNCIPLVDEAFLPYNDMIDKITHLGFKQSTFSSRYMDSSDDDSTDSHVIQLKPCPRCNTPIRTSLRYGNVIKKRLQDIEKVKIAAHGHPSEMNETKEKLQSRLSELKKISNGGNTEKDLQRLERSVNRLAKGTVAAVTKNQVTLMERYCVMSQRLNQHLFCEPRVKLGAHIRREGAYFKF